MTPRRGRRRERASFRRLAVDPEPNAALATALGVGVVGVVGAVLAWRVHYVFAVAQLASLRRASGTD